jgi:hypothetical protein
MSCDVQAAGTIELYFYGELPPADRVAVQAHVSGCPECRLALDDLSVIRAALGGRPDVATPPGGDWSGFMGRLNAAVVADQSRPMAAAGHSADMTSGSPNPAGRRFAPYLALAATLALLAAGVIAVLHQRAETRDTASLLRPGAAPELPPAVLPANRAAEPDPALMAVSGQHFERSKLVVLGLTTKTGGDDDWSYERGLASSLLSDTRLYRLAAEERGMQPLAEVMGDLELVLLQASMADDPTEASLHHLQRLIQRRDLLTKMDAY